MGYEDHLRPEYRTPRAPEGAVLTVVIAAIVSGVLVVVLPTVAAAGFGKKCSDGDTNSCEIRQNLFFATIPFGIIFLLCWALSMGGPPSA